MRKYALSVMLFFSIVTIGAGIYTAHVDAQTTKEQSNSVSQNESSGNEEKPYGKKKVTIKPGDTLSRIAKTNKTTFVRLFNANENIKHPDVIYPGDKVRIPHPEEKLTKRPIPGAQVDQAVTANVSNNATSYSNPTPAPAANNVSGGVWDKLAACESGGNWSINTGNGYYGGLQFNLGTWQSNGGSGYPHQASKAEQIRVAENLRAARGFSPWPACSAQLGLS